MRDHSTAVARNVIEITKRFLSISGLMATMTGLATGFGFMGFGGLSNTATSRRMQELRVGSTYGGVAAARGAFGTYMDVQQTMLNIANARQDPAQRLALRRLGVPDNASPTDTMAAVLKGAANLYRQFGPNAAAMWQNIPGLSNIVSLEQARMAAGLQPGEIEEQQRAGRRNERGLNIDEKTLREYQRFTSTLQTARENIEATFIRKLGPLAPSLEKLATAFTHFLTSLLNDKRIDQFITFLAGKFEEWAKVVGDEKFVQNVKDFIAKIGEMAEKIGAFTKRVLQFFNLWPGDDEEKPKPGEAAPATPSDPYGPMPQKPGPRPQGTPGLYFDWSTLSWKRDRPEDYSPPPSGWADPNKAPWHIIRPPELYGPPPPPTPATPDLQFRSPPSAIPGGPLRITPGGYSPIAFHPNNYGTQQRIPVSIGPLPLPVTVQFPGGGATTVSSRTTGDSDETMPGGVTLAGGGSYKPAGPQSAKWQEGASWLMNHLTKDLGLTPEQAAGFASNIASESGFDPKAIGPHGDYGIAQWVGSRKDLLFAFAKARRLDPQDRETQWAFMREELTGGIRGDDQSRYLKALRAQRDAEHAQSKSFGYESGESPGLEYHRSDHARFIQQLMQLVQKLLRGQGNPDPGLHQQPREQSVAYRSMMHPVVTVRNETGGSIATSSHLLAV